MLQQGQPYGRSQRGAIKLNDCFFVAKFATENVILHEPKERRFYDYYAVRGLWRPDNVDSLKLRMAAALKQYADSQGESDIERMRSNNRLGGLVEMLRGQAGDNLAQ